MRTMYDSTTVAKLPQGGQLYGGYIDGRWPTWNALWGLFPGAVKVPIAVNATTNAGIVGDCERGNGAPSTWVRWVKHRRHLGVDPTIYCSASLWAQVKAAFLVANEADPHWWIADWDGDPTTILAGAVAKQYESTPGYDVSSVADYWPGVDPKPTTKQPTTPEEVTPDMITQLATGAIAAKGNGGHLLIFTKAPELAHGWKVDDVTDGIAADAGGKQYTLD